MSKNPNVEKAAKVMSRSIKGILVSYPAYLGTACDLDAAGLLVTPLHQRALEACIEADKYEQKGYIIAPAFHACAAVGREALALEKPKERYKAEIRNCAGDGPWVVVPTEIVPMRGAWCSGLSEAQARAVAKALNEVSE